MVERGPDPRAGMRLHLCQMLDQHNVPNGEKAIARFIDERWTAELVERFGPAAAPRTIREWRKNRGRRDRRTYIDMLDLRFAGSRRALGERRQVPHGPMTKRSEAMIPDEPDPASSGPKRHVRSGAIARRAAVMYGLDGLSFVRLLDGTDGFTLLTEAEGIPMSPITRPGLAQDAIEALLRSGGMTRWVDLRWLDDAPDWFTGTASATDRIETAWVLALPQFDAFGPVRPVRPIRPVAPYRRRRTRRTRRASGRNA